MSLWAVLITGLFAGGASCAAVQGGLLAGTVARRRGSAPSADAAAEAPERAVPAQDALPVAGFLAGKLVSHTLLGAALGEPAGTGLL